jgi:hypothetical protein
VIRLLDGQTNWKKVGVTGGVVIGCIGLVALAAGR